MSIGLKRMTVRLEEHDPEWDALAARTIAVLKDLLGPVAVDVQHIGSTSIHGIAAKPILDIAVGVRELDQVLLKNAKLQAYGILYRKQEANGQLLYVMGDFEKDTRTHHIHVMVHDSTAWHNYINFRDYLNYDPVMAARYDALKKRLSQMYSNDRATYTQEKQDLIRQILTAAAHWRENN